MTAQKRSTLLILAAAATGALLSSCAYEYYDHESSGSLAYSTQRPASTSVFIRTSSSRWGYDPTCRSYYDYSRRCYYDPYLNGYYPRGYRPSVVVGAPHPHGWHRGRSTCPPPRNVINRNLSNYRNRHQQYCNLNHSWARNLRNHTPGHSNSIWNRGNHHHQSNNGWNRGNHGGANRHSNPSSCPTSNPARNRGNDHHRQQQMQNAARQRAQAAAAQRQAAAQQRAQAAAAQRAAQREQVAARIARMKQSIQQSGTNGAKSNHPFSRN